MSNKLECPVCGSYSSTIYHAVILEGGNCPVCNTPGDVIDRIDRLRAKRGDEELKAELEQALVQLGKVTAERDRLARIVASVQCALADNDE